MTSSRDDKFWREMADEMQRALYLRPLTDEEAEREYDEAPEVPLTEEQIAEYAKIASSRVPHELSYEERTAGDKIDCELDQEVEEVVGLHRNEGESDPEVEEEMQRQREEALKEDEDDAESPEES